MLIKKIGVNNKEFPDFILFLEKQLELPINAKTIKWEYSYQKERTSIIIVLDKLERIIACWSHIPILISLPARETWTGRCENAFIEKEYRGQGIDLMMQNFAESVARENKIGLIWTSTNAYNLWVGRYKSPVIKEPLGVATILIGLPRLHDYWRKYKTLTYIKYPSHSLKSAINLILFKIMLRKNKKHYRYSNDFIENDVNHLYNRIKKKNKDFCYIKITKEFFNWRIVQNPQHNYKSIFLYDRNKLLSYIIYVVKERTLHISDMMFDHKDFLLILLKRIVKINRKRIKRISFYYNFDFYYFRQLDRYLKKFLATKYFCRELPPITFKKMDKTEEYPNCFKDKSVWHINALWTEGYFL